MLMFGVVTTGLLLILLIVALSVVLIILLVTGRLNLFHMQKSVNTQPHDIPTRFTRAQINSTNSTLSQCLHCGAVMLPSWNHYPQCGASIS
jgi:hypothetical protein